MKQIVIILLIYTGLLLSCNSSKPSSTFSKNSKRKNSASIGAPGTHKASANTPKPATTPLPEAIDADRPHNSVAGPGGGGSYASYYYRRLNKKKPVAAPDIQKNEAYNNTQTDTLNIKTDSIDYTDNSW